MAFLLVPLQLDALRLSTPRTAIEAMADFSELPYNDGTRDINPNTPYVSEAIVPQPFENKNLTLAAGIHLHWALPDALTVQDAGEFPAVPNRWLIVRELDRDGSRQTDKWVVESDYLYPDGAGSATARTNVPVNPAPAEGQPRPFRYMGRVTPFAMWTESGGKPGNEFASPLTAAGFGDPVFAAFYPNCASVFGFYDGELATADVASLRVVYYAIGWYADSTLDPLKIATAGLSDPEALRQTIEEKFEWTFDSASAAPTGPLEALCFGKLSFAANDDAQTVSAAGLEVCIGSTATEALSAYLARQIVETDPATYRAEDRSMLEEQLEALTLEDSVLEREVDTGAAFEQVRHEKEFAAVDAGVLWDLKAKTAASPEASATAASDAAASVLPDAIAERLNQLNDLQERYNRAQDELRDRRRLLFADWYKYQLCAYPAEDQAESYPDIDQVSRFLIERDVAPISRLKHATGTVETTEDDEGWAIAIAAKEPGNDSVLAVQIAATANQLLSELRALAATDPVAYGLRQIPAQRYWQPADPVVLLVGSAVKPSQRHGKDSDGVNGVYLACEVAAVADGTDAATLALSDSLRQTIDGLSESPGVKTWERQPWNPVLLDWEAQFFPLAQGSSVANSHGDYSTRCIQDNYELKIDSTDLSPRAGAAAVMAGAGVYNGTAILTDHATTSLQAQLTDYCEAQIGADYATSAGGSIVVDDAYLASQDHIRSILAWYETEIENSGSANEPRAEDPVYTALRALEILTAPDFFSLSQALGGFNDALNMQRQTLQLEITDPLGFAPFQQLATLVADMVEDAIDRAPQPLSDFNPLRAGCLKLLQLRLIDSFGQYLDLDWSRIVCAEKLNCTWDAANVSLPPRVAEPARLNFNWLSADEEWLELTPSPLASPVCGWVLTNRLENSVMIYDASGLALGSIMPDATENFWADAPGALVPVTTPAQIANPRLRAVVQEVIDRTRADRDFLRSFIGALDSASDSIEPESTAQNQGTSLLVGRPIAVVRAKVSLELQGLPEYDHDWNQFRLDMVTGTRETHGFEDLVVPMRIGEDQQLNDGLVGYWIEDGDRFRDGRYYSLQCEPISAPSIVTRADPDEHDSDENLFNLPLALNGAETALTLLVDPRGCVHATCGIVPPLSLSIPSAHYADALKKIEVTFLTAPILTNRNQICLPLSDEPGLVWSWLSQSPSGWTEIAAQGVIQRTALEGAFPDSTTLWPDLLAAGWLTEREGAGEKAVIEPKDKRPDTVPSTGPDAYSSETLAQVGDFLDRYTIGAVSTTPALEERQVLREGWLKLSPAP